MNFDNFVKKILSVATMSALILSLSACSGINTDKALEKNSKDASKNKVTIGLTYIPNIQFSPFYAAETQKYLPENVVLRHHGSNEGLFDALLAGSEDFVVAGADEAIKAMDSNKNLDLVILSKYYQKYPLSIFALKKKNISKPEDLKGKTIGIPGKFGENYFALLLFMKQNALTEKDINIKEIGYTQIAAMKVAEVDAVVGFTNNDLIQLQESKIEVNTIPISNGEIPLVSASLITTRDFLSKNNEVVDKVISAMEKGVNFALKSPEKILQITADNYVSDLKNIDSKQRALKILLATNELFIKDSKDFKANIDIQECEKMQKFMLDEKLISKKINKTICDRK